MRKLTFSKEYAKTGLTDREHRLLSVIANLEYCRHFLGLLSHSPSDGGVGRSYYLSIVAANLYEALRNFDPIKKDVFEIISKSELGHHLAESWRYVTSKESNLFRKETLARVRNTWTFHVDPQVISEFFEKYEAEESDCVLWSQGSASGSAWESPLAQRILQISALSQFVVSDAQFDRLYDTYTSLSALTRALSTFWFDLTLPE